MNDELKQLQMEANKALTALYIATEESVARDVNEKVRAYVSAWESQNGDDKIKQLVQLVKDLWEARGYGIPEMKLHQRVVDAVALDKSEFYLVGMRPIGPDGLSWVPEIKDGKISYTHHFEVPHE